MNKTNTNERNKQKNSPARYSNNFAKYCCNHSARTGSPLFPNHSKQINLIAALRRKHLVRAHRPQPFSKYIHRPHLAMHQRHRRPLAEGAVPRTEPHAVRMGGEAADGVDLGRHAYLLAPELDELAAVDQRAAQRSLCLVTDDQDMAALAPHVVLEVMTDAAALAHAAAGDDDGAAIDAHQ